MAVQNPIPTTNVKAADIRDTLNYYGGTVTNDTTTFFTDAAGIDKWAKYKPESYKVDFDLSETQRYENNYGFDARSMGFGASVSELFDKAITGEAWVYVLPQGGQTSPFRLGDYRGYNPTAPPPYDYRYFVNRGEGTEDTYSQEQRTLVNSDAELRIEDFSAFDDISASANKYYLWIARYLNGSNYEYITSNAVLASDRPDDIICTLTFPKEGTWQCLFCIGLNDSDTDSSHIESRTDCLAMPNGYKVFEFIKKVLFVHVEMTYPDPSIFGSSMSYSDGVLNFGTEMFSFDLSPSEEGQSIPSTIFQFGLQIFLRNDYGQMGPYVEIMDTVDDIEYSGSSTTSVTIVNFTQYVDLTNYFDEWSLKEATQLEIRPVMNRTSSATNAAYFDTDAVWYVDIN